MSAPGIWVTRPHPAGQASTSALVRAGYPALAIPLLTVAPLADVALPAAPPDWILFVSANAVRGLDAAGSWRAPAEVRVAAVGTRTAQAARVAGWEVHLVAMPENAEGLMQALGEVPISGATFWIPRGNRDGSGSLDLPRFLSERGARVESFPVYATDDRELTSSDVAALDGAAPGLLVLHSPSAVDSLFRADRPEPVLRWRTRARYLSIGPRTTERLGSRSPVPPVECDEPSDEALVRAVAGTGLFPEEGTPRA